MTAPTVASQLAHKFIDERLVITIILLNALALFLGDYGPHTAPDSFWFGVDYACVVYFALETVIKLRVLGVRAYFTNNWNRIDFVIIVVSLPVLLSPWVEMYWMSSLTALRLLRLFRLFRLFRFIPGRDQMAAGIVRSLKASVGVFLGVVLVNIILALGAVVLFGENADDPHFGTPWRAVYSMFRVFTIEGWYEIPDRIAMHSGTAWGAFARVYFSMAVFGGGILGLSLVNAVFVDQMTADNTDPITHRLDQMNERFASLEDEIRALRDALREQPNADAPSEPAQERSPPD